MTHDPKSGYGSQEPTFWVGLWSSWSLIWPRQDGPKHWELSETLFDFRKWDPSSLTHLNVKVLYKLKIPSEKNSLGKRKRKKRRRKRRRQQH
jgi:hypothetical protein